MFANIEMSIDRAESKKIKESIKRACKEESSRNARKRKVRKYNTYSQEEKDKYAAENGATKAVTHFSKKGGIEMNKSTLENSKTNNGNWSFPGRNLE